MLKLSRGKKKNMKMFKGDKWAPYIALIIIVIILHFIFVTAPKNNWGRDNMKGGGSNAVKK